MKGTALADDMIGRGVLALSALTFAILRRALINLVE